MSPSMASTWPEMVFAASDARNNASAAISPGSVKTFSD